MSQRIKESFIKINLFATYVDFHCDYKSSRSRQRIQMLNRYKRAK